MIIGIPTYNGFIRSELCSFLQETSGHKIIVITHTSTDIARNKLVAHAQYAKQNLFMVDADCCPPPGAFKILMDKVSEEVCVAALPYCSSAGAICVGERSPLPYEVEKLIGWHKTDGLGTHCIAYNIKAFDLIERPYYYYEMNPWHTALLGCAEDTTLHRRLRDAGIPLYINWSYWAGHVVDKQIDKPRTLTETEWNLVRPHYWEEDL